MEGQEQLDRMEIQLTQLQGKLDAVLSSSEKMRKYFLWTLIITGALIIIPLVLLPLFIGPFLQSQGVSSATSLGL